MKRLFMGVLLAAANNCISVEGKTLNQQATASSGVWAVVDLISESYNGTVVVPGAYVQEGQLHNAGGPSMLRFHGTWKRVSSESPLPLNEGGYEWFEPIVEYDRPLVHRTISPFQSGGRIRCRISFGPNHTAQFADVDWAPETASVPAAVPAVKADLTPAVKTVTPGSGRFSFSIPSGMSLDYTEQTIYTTPVKTFAYDSGKSDVLWKESLSAIVGKSIPPADFQQSLAAALVDEKGAPSQWYFEDLYYPSSRLLLALRRWGDHVVVVYNTLPRGKEAQAEKLLSRLLEAYQPGDSTGFAVGRGKVLAGPAQAETTRWGLSHQHFSDLKITAQTQTIQENSRIDKLDPDDMAHFAKASKGSSRVLSRSRRTIAGMKGEEIRMSVTLPKEGTLLFFFWNFIGVANEATQPHVRIRGEAEGSHQTELERVWDALLSSLQSRPIQ